MSLIVAAIQPPAALYREEQRFGWWIYALLALMIAVAWPLFLGRGPMGPNPVGLQARQMVFGLGVGLFMPAVLVVGVLRLTTIVTPAEVRVWFGFVPTYRRSIPIESIASVEVVQYRPIADYGGWGIRHGKDGERVYNARGDRGVRLLLLDGTKVLIGSQRPEELALAVEGSRRPGH